MASEISVVSRQRWIIHTWSDNSHSPNPNAELGNGSYSSNIEVHSFEEQSTHHLLLKSTTFDLLQEDFNGKTVAYNELLQCLPNSNACCSSSKKAGPKFVGQSKLIQNKNCVCNNALTAGRASIIAIAIWP